MICRPPPAVQTFVKSTKRWQLRQACDTATGSDRHGKRRRPVLCLRQITETCMALDDKTRTELEAAVFRRLVEHLRTRTDVQNIDLMNLAGFCRNCLSNWMKEEADKSGVALDRDASREAVYGMPYEEWKAKFQREASTEKRAAFDKSVHNHCRRAHRCGGRAAPLALGARPPKTMRLDRRRRGVPRPPATAAAAEPTKSATRFAKD